VAEDLASQQPVALPAPSQPLVEQRRAVPTRRLFRWRFAIAYVGLAVAAGVGVGGAIVAYDRAPADEVAWSTWRPQGDEFTYPRQIATYVGRKYRLPSGDPLVGVIASEAQVPAGDGSTVLPIRGAAIFNNPSGDSRDYTTIETNDTILYTMCGFGQGCSIEGRPSEDRMLLLHREALELALHSFRYVSGLDTVIALLPTNLGDQTTAEDDTATTLFFQRKDFKAELDRPLIATLTTDAPALGKISSAEELTLERLTSGRHYRFQFTPTQTNSLVMLLVPVQ
jgi:hypothetical protein